MSSELKLEEAAFFIELLAALEERGESLTLSNDTAKEASFLFAAILNSFYSTIVILERQGIDAKAFRASHPEIYAQGMKGGERGKTVHLAHVETAHSGYIPPNGNSVNFTFRRLPKLAMTQLAERGRVDLRFKPQHYIFIELRSKKEHALSFCSEHFSELVKFHRANAPAASRSTQTDP